MELLSNLNVPERCRLNQRITKKVFLENVSATSAEKRLVRDLVREMTILASFSPATINIPAYTSTTEVYDEILMVEVVLDGESVAKKVASMVQRAIPYHTMLWIRCGSRVMINLAPKQVNQNDGDKRVVAEMIFTQWMEAYGNGNHALAFMDSLAVERLPHDSLMAFYNGMVCSVIGRQIEDITGMFKTVPLNERTQNSEMLEQLRTVNEQLNSLYGTIKTETQFNRKVEMNMQIKTLENSREDIRQKLHETS